jgi:hypothetical protein
VERGGQRAAAEIRPEGLDLIESPEFHAQGLLSSFARGGPPMVVTPHARVHLPTSERRGARGSRSIPG